MSSYRVPSLTQREWLMVATAISEKALVAEAAKRALDEGHVPEKYKEGFEFASEDCEAYRQLALKLATFVIDPHHT